MNIAVISGIFMAKTEKFYPARDGKNAMLLFQIRTRNGRNAWGYVDCRAYAETAESLHRNVSGRQPAIELIGRTVRQEDREGAWRQYLAIDSWRYAPTSKDTGDEYADADSGSWSDDDDDD